MRIRKLLIIIVALLAAYGILVAVAELPPYGMADNPSTIMFRSAILIKPSMKLE